MKTLIISLDPNLQIRQEGNFIIKKIAFFDGIIDDIVYDMVMQFNRHANLSSRERANIIRDFNNYNPDSYLKLTSYLIDEISTMVMSDFLPVEFPLSFSYEYVNWLYHHENKDFKIIGEELKSRGNRVLIKAQEIYNNNIQDKIIRYIPSFLQAHPEIKHFTIINCNNDNSSFVRDILNKTDSIKFEHFTGAFIQNLLGEAYYTGIGADKNISQSIYHYQNAADKGNLNSINKLGEFYQKGLGLEKDLAKAVALFRKVADENYPLGMYNLAYCFEMGLGIECDVKRAVQYYEKAAKDNIPEAQFRLANIYYEGKLGESNYEQAFKWYKIYTESELEPLSFYRIGCMYLNGKGIHKNLHNAFMYLDKASEYNIEDACYLCGKLLEDRLVENFDNKPHDALNYYQKGALKGEYKSATEYAVHIKHEGDIDKAMSFLKIGIEIGYDKAQFESAMLFNDILSTLKSEAISMLRDQLITLAASQGYEPAIKFREELKINQ